MVGPVQVLAGQANICSMYPCGVEDLSFYKYSSGSAKYRWRGLSHHTVEPETMVHVLTLHTDTHTYPHIHTYSAVSLEQNAINTPCGEAYFRPYHFSLLTGGATQMNLKHVAIRWGHNARPRLI